MKLIETLEAGAGKAELPALHVGDTVDVHYLIREGEKERIQLFTGTVIALGGRGLRRMVTVRRIVAGEGVERIFPMHSPRVQDITIGRRGNVRRAKLYFLRDRVGKRTRVKELVGEKVRRQREQERERRRRADSSSAAAREPEAGSTE